jgi:hypothetical protein
MAYTIARVANTEIISISDGTKIEYHPYDSFGKMYANGDDVILQMRNAGAVSSFREVFSNITTPAGTSLGNATYDETGGAEEDLWTLATHGLSVGDSVIFTAAGTGATGYAASTRYYVAAVPSANTFTLSDTLGGDAIEGTGDSSGTWTIARYSAQDKVNNIVALFTTTTA